MNPYLNTIIKDIEAQSINTRTDIPVYHPNKHVSDIATCPYFRQLNYFRHIIKHASDVYMTSEQRAVNVDLFMLTPSVSSPMGPGSDSEPIKIKFGKYDTYLTDSSQFGFEPILMNGINRAYCYLPSLRGEDPDSRHLNQFYHCEMEIAGNLEDIMSIVEGYVTYLAQSIAAVPKLSASLSRDITATKAAIDGVLSVDKFPRIDFDDACELLIGNGYTDCVNVTDHGRDITAAGESALCELLKAKTPIWIMCYDRDRVPFYQMPLPDNPDKVFCADLICPPLIDGSFGGEVVGAGQRQSDVQAMDESLARQNVDNAPYDWYIDLRRHPNYRLTSGFGLGIERFIAWILCLDNIRDAILYPREKNVLSKP